jgi:hypothetical protein
MVFRQSNSQKMSVLKLLIVIVILCGHMTLSPNFLQRLDEFMFDLSVKVSLFFAKVSGQAAITYVKNSPRMVSLAIALYFHKEILSMAKNCGTNVIGEHPCMSLIVGLSVLYAGSWWIDNHELVTH